MPPNFISLMLPSRADERRCDFSSGDTWIPAMCSRPRLTPLTRPNDKQVKTGDFTHLKIGRPGSMSVIDSMTMSAPSPE
jgi:hypothetical protein